MIGFLVLGRVRFKSRIRFKVRVRVSVGVTLTCFIGSIFAGAYIVHSTQNLPTYIPGFFFGSKRHVYIEHSFRTGSIDR